MAVDVTEADFEQEVIEGSRSRPVVVDFWAEWCGPCRTLTPALEAAEAARAGKVLLAKVDVDANQMLAARHGVQGIPAVKAFRDGAVVDEFVGAVPKERVEAFFDGLVPSRADELLAAGDELSLREASELEPRRADVAVALARLRLERGAEDAALEAVESFEGDFAAEGLAARIRLTRAGIAADAFAALDRGDRDAALQALLAELDPAAPKAGAADRAAPADGPAAADRAAPADGPAAVDRGAADGEAPLIDRDERRELLRRAVVGILSEADPSDPAARDYRRRLAAALY